MRISDWSSDVCSSDLGQLGQRARNEALAAEAGIDRHKQHDIELVHDIVHPVERAGRIEDQAGLAAVLFDQGQAAINMARGFRVKRNNIGTRLGELRDNGVNRLDHRSEEHTSELQSLMRISYAVLCLKKQKNTNKNTNT